jgi:alkylhydroperoxidase family enzyme
MERDPSMTTEWAFRTMIFWVVSRSNNCIYCMGHQESSLPMVGVTEDRLAAMDGDWSEFTLAERAAFALTRKLTVAPHTISDADIDAVRRYYTDLQVLEFTALVAGFNAMNRWTGPLRLTQEDFRLFLTPTSLKYESIITKVGPVPRGATGVSCTPAASPRPAPEPREAVEAKWAECRRRKARFPLVEEKAARALLPEGAFRDGAPLPNWVRLLVNFPKAGPVKVAQLQTSEFKGNLPARLKAELAWVSARADRAWYALACARDRLRAAGLDDDTIFAIDEASGSAFTPAERAAFAFARKVTVDPALIDDTDFDALRKFYNESEIAEMLFHVNHAVFFNILTEAAGLPLDDTPKSVTSR